MVRNGQQNSVGYHDPQVTVDQAYCRTVVTVVRDWSTMVNNCSPRFVIFVDQKWLVLLDVGQRLVTNGQ